MSGVDPPALARTHTHTCARTRKSQHTRAPTCARTPLIATSDMKEFKTTRRSTPPGAPHPASPAGARAPLPAAAPAHHARPPPAPRPQPCSALTGHPPTPAYPAHGPPLLSASKPGGGTRGHGVAGSGLGRGRRFAGPKTRRRAAAAADMRRTLAPRRGNGRCFMCRVQPPPPPTRPHPTNRLTQTGSH